MSARPSIAVIVPVLGDAEPLRALLERLAVDDPRPDEIVVVDGGADERIAALCRERGCTYVAADPNRGAQLDRGAAAATSEILWFLHADACPPPGALALIADAVRRGADGGCFRFAFQGPRTWYKALLERLVAWRVRLGGTPYGDQGLFATRRAYCAAGGFPHQPLFEEVRLVRRLRAGGRFVALPAAIEVSTRRWERDGWWYRTLHNRWLALCYAAGVPAERLARAYRGLLGWKR
ncbi:MAG TPA: TIGR04283 family arsenosugar biosynthesis glycosyltransferase [Gammaproteobacteria bacterium]